MRTRHVGWALAALAFLIAGATAVFVASAGAPERAAPGEAAFPPALAAHLDKLGEALPGNGGESSEGPGAAASAAARRRDGGSG